MVQREFLDFEAFLERSSEFDRAVGQTPGIDPFCSSSVWTMPARASFSPHTEPAIYQLEHGWLAMMRDQFPGWGNCLMPLEFTWQLSCPIIGAQPHLIARDIHLLLREQSDWDTVFFSGLAKNGPQWIALINELSEHFPMYLIGVSAGRCIASLQDGQDGYLSRRSKSFRKNLRNAQRRAKPMDLQWEYWDKPIDRQQTEALYNRVLQIENKSWKGMMDSGLTSDEMRQFYHQMIHMLGPSGNLRLLFVYIDGKEAGYVLGGMMGPLYRGLQFSFDDQYAAISLGNLLQWKQINLLIDQGEQWYDLGTDVPYKHRWAEINFQTHALAISKLPPKVINGTED